VARREFEVDDRASTPVHVVRLDAGTRVPAHERIAEETPVALVYNGIPHVVVMASPVDLGDLALGFSLSEAVIGSAAELGGMEVVAEKAGYSVYLSVPAARVEVLAQRRRNMTARTGCGLCGAETIEQAMHDVPRVVSSLKVAPGAVARAMQALPSLQALNGATGAVHAAAWANPEGELQLVREDVGRHNALDKLIGALVAAGTDRAAGFAVVTSRASYEMVQKAAMAGIGLLAAVSAPTALAVRIAQQAGITLAGFARGSRCVVYADPARRLTTQEDWKA
jgi:FdhD protein